MAAPKLLMGKLKKKTRRYEDIVRIFTQKIRDGELNAGDKLPTERELVDILEVSRSSIREALRAMELIGMVHSKVGEGTFVKQCCPDHPFLHFADDAAHDDSQVLEVYEVRALLEGYSARLAAKRRDEGHLARMREAIQCMKDDIDGGNRAQSPDTLFHRIVAEATGNGMLIGIISYCSDTISSSITISNAYVATQDIISEHQRMYEAIDSHDGRLSERLMRAHINRARRRMELLLRRKGGSK